MEVFPSLARYCQAAHLVLVGLGPARPRHALRSLGDQQGGEEIQQVACAGALALLCAKGMHVHI